MRKRVGKALGIGLLLAAIAPIADAQSFQKNFTITVNPPAATVTNISCGTGTTLTENIPPGQTTLTPGTVICPVTVTMSDGSVYGGNLAALDCTGLGTGCVAATRFVLSSAKLPSNLVVGTTPVPVGNYFTQLQTLN